MGEVIPKLETPVPDSGGQSRPPGTPGLQDPLSDPLEACLPTCQPGQQVAQGGGPPSRFNTSWLDALENDAVRRDIDMIYSRENALAHVPQVAEVDKKIATAVKKYGKKHQSVLDLQAERERIVASLSEDEINAAKVGKVGKLDGAESVDGRIFKEEVDAGEGRKIVRENFMGEMVGLLGTPEAVETWFGSIRRASVPGGPQLHDKAAGRLEKAKTSFESKNGVKFLSSTVAFAMRGRQNTRQGKGMLSHATGMAIDYQAYQNPHLKDWQQRVMLETVTGGPTRLMFTKDSGKELNYGERRAIIKKLGKETEAGQAHDAGGQAFINDKVDQAFDAHVQTEIDFRKSLDVGGDGADDDIARLRSLAERFWTERLAISDAAKKAKTLKGGLDKARTTASGRIKAAHIKDLDRQITEARSAVTARAQEEGKKLSGKQISESEEVRKLVDERATYAKTGPDSAIIEADAQVSTARTAYDQAAKALQAIKQPFVDELARIIQPWIAKFDARMDTYRPALEGGSGLPDQKLVTEVLGQVKLAQKSRDPAKALEALRAKPRYAPLLAGISQDIVADPARLREHLEQVMARIRASASARESLGALQQVRDRLTGDLEFVLGKGKVDKASGKMVEDLKVSDPSALQFLQVGLVFGGGTLPNKQAPAGGAPGSENAAQGAAAGQAENKELAQHDYFREFTRTMMDHGFEAAGAWESADTMHFELIEGMDELQASGAGLTFGPEGKRAKE